MFSPKCVGMLVKSTINFEIFFERKKLSLRRFPTSSTFYFQSLPTLFTKLVYIDSKKIRVKVNAMNEIALFERVFCYFFFLPFLFLLFLLFSPLKIFDEVNDGHRAHVQLSVIIVYLPLRGREPQTRR